MSVTGPEPVPAAGVRVIPPVVAVVQLHEAALAVTWTVDVPPEAGIVTAVGATVNVQGGGGGVPLPQATPSKAGRTCGDAHCGCPPYVSPRAVQFCAFVSPATGEPILRQDPCFVGSQPTG